MGRQDETTEPGGERAAPNRWWEGSMTIAMDELDVSFLTPTGAPIWQPLGCEVVRSAGEPATLDDGWSEIALQLEWDRMWAELGSLIDGEH
jgi:hypothetical protein